MKSSIFFTNSGIFTWCIIIQKMFMNISMVPISNKQIIWNDMRASN